MEPIRVLYINGGIMDRGGISAYMMNYYRHIDRTKVQIDFVVHGFERGVFDDEIRALGGLIYNVPIKSKDYFGNIKALRKIFKSDKYKIVHSHMDAMGMVVLKEAKHCGIPVRIAHSHNTQHLTNNKIKHLFNEYARKNITRYATHLCACSKPAARWLFGDKNVDENKVIYIKNAIDIKKYEFNIDSRESVRNKYNLKDSFVIGHVGRFDYQKNHIFLLKIFSKLVKNIPKARLFLVGDGHLRREIEYETTRLNLKDKVIMAGVRDDVHYLMNGFDVFCLPSLFEGLGIVLIEAQANGLECIASSEVPLESNVDDKVTYIKLKDSYKTWVDSLLTVKINNLDRNIHTSNFINSGYSIVHEAKKLESIYLALTGVEYDI
jgi:glycosyltransferase involved in cell wall biosynthesis